MPPGKRGQQNRKLNPDVSDMNLHSINEALAKARQATITPEREADLSTTRDIRSSLTLRYGPPSNHAKPAKTAKATTGSRGRRGRNLPSQEKTGWHAKATDARRAQANMVRYGKNCHPGEARRSNSKLNVSQAASPVPRQISGKAAQSENGHFDRGMRHLQCWFTRE